LISTFSLACLVLDAKMGDVVGLGMSSIFMRLMMYMVDLVGGGDKVDDDDDEIDSGGLKCKKRGISNFCC